MSGRRDEVSHFDCLVLLPHCLVSGFVLGNMQCSLTNCRFVFIVFVVSDGQQILLNSKSLILYHRLKFLFCCSSPSAQWNEIWPTNLEFKFMVEIGACMLLVSLELSTQICFFLYISLPVSCQYVLGRVDLVIRYRIELYSRPPSLQMKDTRSNPLIC